MDGRTTMSSLTYLHHHIQRQNASCHTWVLKQVRWTIITVFLSVLPHIKITVNLSQIGRDLIFHVLVIKLWNLCVTQLSVKQAVSPADLVRAPGTTQCPLPPIEVTKNGLPCSHGGKPGMDNGRAGWTLDHRLWFKPKPEIQTQTFSDRDNNAYRKGNFKWTIVGFVLAAIWGHSSTIYTLLVGAGRANIKQKMSKALLHIFPSLNFGQERRKAPSCRDRQVIIKLGMTQHKQTHSGLVKPVLWNMHKIGLLHVTACGLDITVQGHFLKCAPPPSTHPTPTSFPP